MVVVAIVAWLLLIGVLGLAGIRFARRRARAPTAATAARWFFFPPGRRKPFSML